jgi:hypothetical protein
MKAKWEQKTEWYRSAKSELEGESVKKGEPSN